MLSVDLLEDLKARWVTQEAPLLPHLRPGLTDDQMDEITAPLNLRLPDEARVWWGWHDGVEMVRENDARQMIATWRFVRLREAVEEAGAQLDLSREIFASTPGLPDDFELWCPSWVPISIMNACIVAVDCAERGPVSPVHYKDRDGASSDDGPVVPSLGVLVTWWIEALDDGSHRYDAEARRWDYDFDRRPPGRRIFS